MKNRERDLVRLQHISEAIELIEQFSEGIKFDHFTDDVMMQSAIIRQFEIIGEASANLTDDLKERYPEVEWRVIKDFRNLLVHEYSKVDVGEVWSAISNDIPILKEQINRIIEEF